MRLRDCVTLAHSFVTEWSSPEYVERVQRRRLQRMIRHAYDRVPYYRRLLDAAKVRPEDVRSAADLRVLPVTTKDDLRELPAREVTAGGTDLSRCRTHTTSGTTGAPLVVYFGTDDWTRLKLGDVRAFTECGTRPWHRVAAFVGRTDPSKPKPWYEYLGLWKQRDLSSWHSPESWIEDLRRWQPHMIVGCVVTLRVLAELMQERGVDDIRPRLVVSGSNVLDDVTRALLASVFHCPVRDFYGATEAGAMAWECPECNAYHVSADIGILEVLQGGEAAAPGVPGDVVITNLQYRAMPFIRYAMGDVATLSTRQPRCGRALPLLERIGGRRDEWICLPSGKNVPCQPFFYAIQSVEGVRRWKVIQESFASVRVEIQPDDRFTGESRELVRSNVRNLLNGEIEPEIVLTESIAMHPAMKIRQVTSLVLARPSDESRHGRD